MQDKFYQILESAYQEQKTGTIHLFGRSAEGRQLYHVILMEAGQVCYIGRASRPEPVPLATVLALEITGVQFSPSRRNWMAQGSVPDVPAILAQLKRQGVNGRSAATATATSAPPQPRATNGQAPVAVGNLRLEAVAVLQKLYGKSAYNLVAEVSQKSPPERSAQQFIDGCVEQASHAVGPEMAAQMFAHLR
ncbi:MAG: hypothetical protein KDE56_23070 [Anaerolineales bacterium]|nr:hypothetical protein [Anaerolineales bacterium]